MPKPAILTNDNRQRFSFLIRANLPAILALAALSFPVSAQTEIPVDKNGQACVTLVSNTRTKKEYPGRESRPWFYRYDLKFANRCNFHWTITAKMRNGGEHYIELPATGEQSDLFSFCTDYLPVNSDCGGFVSWEIPAYQLDSWKEKNNQKRTTTNSGTPSPSASGAIRIDPYAQQQEERYEMEQRQRDAEQQRRQADAAAERQRRDAEQAWQESQRQAREKSERERRARLDNIDRQKAALDTAINNLSNSMEQSRIERQQQERKEREESRALNSQANERFANNQQEFLEALARRKRLARQEKEEQVRGTTGE